MTTKLYKYPRTPHLPYSRTRTDDDKILDSDEHFVGQWVVITEKMDGENFSGYKDDMHARSVDGRSHPSRDWVKQFHSTFAHDIPEGARVCGENLYAKHSIEYDDLESYFYGFSYWEGDFCYDWDCTLLMFELLGITPVKVLFEGIYTTEIGQNLAKSLDTTKQEGFVVRLASSFNYADFKVSVAKFVRPKHVQTSKHWALQEVIPNKLKTF